MGLLPLCLPERQWSRELPCGQYPDFLAWGSPFSGCSFRHFLAEACGANMIKVIRFFDIDRKMRVDDVTTGLAIIPIVVIQ
jgi:hypothetical protein